jgi:crossover junction endodeoxyribonuclease RusA
MAEVGGMITFTVYGHPEPQGSTKAFIPKGWNRAIITSDNTKLKPWRQELTRAALEANRNGLLPLSKTNGSLIAREIPVCVRMDFFLAKPVSTPKRVTRPTKKPDIDKLTRAIFDSLTGTVITDDSQIVEALVGKWYGIPERVEIFVSEAQNDLRVHEQTNVESYSLFA